MDNWNKNYELAKNYYKSHKNLNIPAKYRTFDGIREISIEDPRYQDATKLGEWLSTQILNYKKENHGILTIDQIEKLKTFNINWDSTEDKWNRMFNLAKKYYENHGNLNVPVRFKTKDGITESEDGYLLGMWIAKQKKSYQKEKLTEEKEKKLKQIGMTFPQQNNNENDSQKLILILDNIIKNKEAINKDKISKFMDQVSNGLVPTKLAEYLYNYLYQNLGDKINLTFRNNTIILLEQGSSTAYSKIELDDKKDEIKKTSVFIRLDENQIKTQKTYSQNLDSAIPLVVLNTDENSYKYDEDLETLLRNEFKRNDYKTLGILNRDGTFTYNAYIKDSTDQYKVNIKKDILTTQEVYTNYTPYTQKEYKNLCIANQIKENNKSNEINKEYELLDEMMNDTSIYNFINETKYKDRKLNK